MAKIIILLLIFISYAAVLNARAGYKGKGNESTVLNGSGRRTKGGQSDYRSTSSQIADVTNADPLLEQVDYNPKRVPRGADDGPHSVNYRHARPEDPHGYFTTPKNLRRNPKDMLNIPAKNVSDKETVLVQNPLYPINESSYGAYAVMLLALILFAVGIVGNLALMCTVWHNYYLKTVWNSILASLAFWDFLVLFFCLPVVVFNELTTKRLLGNISCRIVPYMEVTSLGVATFSLCALSIDRFYAVTSPRRLQISQVEPCQSILSKLSVIWVGSLVLAVPELLLWQLTQEYVGSSLATQNGSPTSMMGFQESQSETSTLAVLRPQNSAFFVDMCVRQPSLDLPETVYSLVLTYHEARMWWYFGCYFCLPLLFTLACNLVTWHVATQHTPEKSTVANGDHSLTSSSSSSTKIKQHVKREQSLSSAVTAFAVVYAVCNLPENACNITLAYISIPMTVGTKALLALIGQFLLFLRCSVTPVFLLCLCRSLGQAFIDCCCCCCEECLHDRTSSPSLLSASTTGTSASPYSISPHLPPSPCSTPSSNKDNKEKLTVVSGTPGTDCERKAGSSPVVARVTSC